MTENHDTSATQPRAIYCPSSDHDGARIATTRYVDVQWNTDSDTSFRTEHAYCDWCAEGFVTQAVRAGRRVTIWAVEPATGTGR